MDKIEESNRELKIKKSLEYFENLGIPMILDPNLLLEGRESPSSIVIFVSIFKSCLEKKFKNKFINESGIHCLSHNTKGECQQCTQNEISLSLLENLIEEKT